MNILLTTDAFPPGAGGSGRSTATLASGLARRGHRVRVVVSRAEPKGQSDWEGIAVSEIEIPNASLGSHARESAYCDGLLRVIGEEAWDVVHAQHWISAMASAKVLPRLPMVVTVRDYWPVCIWSTMLSGENECPGCSYRRRVVCVGRRRPWLWPVTPALPLLVGAELARRQRTLAGASSVVAVSEHVRRMLHDVVSDERIHVIPNFVNLSEAEPPRPQDVPERYVLFVGKLEPNKAPDRLFPVIADAECELPLLVAGSGSMKEGLEHEARRRGLDVRFLGWVAEERARALTRHASALLFPSRWQEPLSRVLVDGLALGAVLIVEPTGGSEDAVVHGESGLIGRGPSELAAALRRVLDDDALAERLRRGARARAESVFSDESVIPRIEAVYQKVIAS